MNANERTYLAGVARRIAVAAICILSACQVALASDTREQLVVTIDFGNGGSPVEIVFRSPTGLLAFDDYALPREYRRLKDLALNGDKDAAFALYRMLSSCQRTYSTESELEAAVTELRETRRLKAWPEPNVAQELPEGTNLYLVELQHLRAPFERCRGISPKQRDEARSWLESAANAGRAFAVRELAQLEESPHDAVRLWKNAWDTGSLESLSALGSLHRNLASDATVAAEGRRNRVMAYSYALIYAKLVGAISASRPTSMVMERRSSEAQKQLQQIESELVDDEIDDASSLARAVLAENRNCCFFGL